MSAALVDTSVFIAAESGRGLLTDALPGRVAVSVITIGELQAGVLSAPDLATRTARLATLTSALAMKPVPVDAGVASAWARLRVLLREHGARMAINDSWIAATALHLGVPVVTQDHGFPDLPGLEVIQI